MPGLHGRQSSDLQRACSRLNAIATATYDGYSAFSTISLDPTADKRKDSVEHHLDIMRAVVSSLMVALLAIQTVFGCCWHHSHWHLHGHSSLAREAEPVKCCQHHHQESESQPSPEPCNHHDECRGLSAYLLPQKVQIDASHSVPAFDMATSVASLAEDQIACPFLWGDVGCSHAIEPPLRLHLLHQTLLI